MEYAFAQTIGSAPEKFVLATIAWFANEDGIAWPNLETIAKRVDLSESQVKRHVSALKRKGQLDRVTQDVPGHGKLKVFVLPGFKAWAEAEANKVVPLRRTHAPKKGASMRQTKAHTCAHNKDSNKDVEQAELGSAGDQYQGQPEHTRASSDARPERQDNAIYDAEGNWISDEIPFPDA